MFRMRRFLKFGLGVIGAVISVMFVVAKFLPSEQCQLSRVAPDAIRDSIEARNLSDPASNVAALSLDGKGSVSGAGIFSTTLPDFVSPDYEAAAFDPSMAGEETAGLVVSDGMERSRIGLVSIDHKSRTISFPARLNMCSGIIEYAVVNSKGKTHEALLTTEALPLHVHLAALLLRIARAEGGGEPTKVSIEVEWQPNGPARRVRLESLIARVKGVPLDPSATNAAKPGDEQVLTEPGDSLELGPWVYGGSLVRRGALMAAVEGSVISLLNDPAALISNPRPGNSNDRLHVPANDLPPAPNFPVVIHLRPFSES